LLSSHADAVIGPSFTKTPTCGEGA
jgi:hypothetical protein